MYSILYTQIIDIVKGAAPFFEDTEGASHIHVKGLADYVTDIDFQVQSYFQEKLSSLYPDIQFMGEEKDNKDIDVSGSFWILDPVDGTTNLIHRFRHSAVSLALVLDGVLSAGIVYDPYADELFFAEKGKGAFRNGSPIHVSANQTMADSLISIGTAPYRHDCAQKNFLAFREIFLRCQDIRRIGSAAIDLAYVACGRTDAFFEIDLKPWDYAAGILLVREAGGTATDYQGGSLPLDRPSSMLASNGFLQRDLLELLS